MSAGHTRQTTSLSLRELSCPVLAGFLKFRQVCRLFNYFANGGAGLRNQTFKLAASRPVGRMHFRLGSTEQFDFPPGEEDGVAEHPDVSRLPKAAAADR
jgi:hypothetical protein